MKRSTFIKNTSLSAFGISVFGTISWNGKNYVGDTPTTTDILGPFYRPHAPLRANLMLPNTKGIPLILKGNILNEDGKIPIENALVEIWHCDENEVYDNTSDNFNYRGGQITKASGYYNFKTIIPVPYQATPNDNNSWRPAHIHLRVSVKGKQDLITQIYFKDGKYVDTDKWASSPNAKNRILRISKTESGINEVNFNIVLQKEYKLDKSVYDKIIGVYDVGNNNTFEFIKNDDLLFTKINGQLSAGLKYIGDNKFEGGIDDPKVVFILQKNAETLAKIENEGKSIEGKRILKY